MAKVQVGINGFGRTGRLVLRALLARYADQLEVVGLNDPAEGAILAHLLRHDTDYGPFPGEVLYADGAFTIDGCRLAHLRARRHDLPVWGDLGADIVIECVPWYRPANQLVGHLCGGGAKKVIVAATVPASDLTIVPGINQRDYDPERHHVLSASSVTVHAYALLAKFVLDHWGVEWGLATVLRSQTNDPTIQDAIHADWRRGRAAAANVAPTFTPTGRAVSLVLPQLRGKLGNSTIRVPVPCVSAIDLTVQIVNPCGSIDDVNAALRAAVDEPYIGCSDEELVSSDYLGDPRSCIVDLRQTCVLVDHALRLLAWFDSRWSYACRIAELTAFVANSL